MKRSIAALLTILAVVVGGLVAGLGTATAGTTTHTKRLVMHADKFHATGKYSQVSTDVARSRKTGHIVGYDTVALEFLPKTQKVLLQVAFSLKGGIILTRLVAHPPTHGFVHFAGVIVSGAGKYSGVTGTVTGKSPTSNQNKTFVTLNYKL
jgi:hypothetical protein